MNVDSDTVTTDPANQISKSDYKAAINKYAVKKDFNWQEISDLDTGEEETTAKSFNGAFKLSENVSNSVDEDGTGSPDTMSYQAIFGQDNGQYISEIKLNINGVEFDDALNKWYSARSGAYVYAADLNVNDEYKNIIINFFGEDDSANTVIYAYSGSDIERLEYLHGMTGISDLNGDGHLTYYYSTNIGTKENNLLGFKSVQTIQDTSVDKQEQTFGGHVSFTGNENATFTEGFSAITSADIMIYSDSNLNSQNGVIPAGTTISVVSYDFSADSSLLLHLTSAVGDGWIDSKYFSRDSIVDYYAVS